ncbi:MAG: hypothetical protein LBQ16_04665 [Gracilibacteraceae bacterium]|jgi:hypothetical protein|nr:hypothetical protein [Gracilibacteraceae bacterium]
MIEVPIQPLKIDEVAAAKAAVAAFRKKAKRDSAARNPWCETDAGLWYYPYYIGTIKTIYPRFMFGPKIIMFYVVCDAIDGTYIVLRNIPQMQQIECIAERILPMALSQKTFVNTMCVEARDTRVNRQFIFGVPDSEYKGTRMIFLPGYLVHIYCNTTKMTECFVNGFTREVKTVIREESK